MRKIQKCLSLLQNVIVRLLEKEQQKEGIYTKTLSTRKRKKKKKKRKIKQVNQRSKDNTYSPPDVLDKTDRSSSPPGGPGRGFLPSFKAFLISAAFHAAYFCFCSSWNMGN